MLGAAAAIATFVSIALLYAFEHTPFAAPAETAHVGYAHEIARGRLPEVTEFPAVPDSAVQWQAEGGVRDDRYRGVWVANHPPLHYLVAAPLIWLSNAMDRPDGGLMFLRLVNIAFAAAGVWFTYLLARELSGGVRRLGVVAAAFAAFVPQGQVVFSVAMNDGLGFAAGTAVVWAGVRCVSTGTGPGRFGRGDLIVLGAATAACAGARIATLALAVVVVVWVAVARLRTAPGSPGARVGAAATVAAYGLVPAAVLFGWHYVRNQRLYGDFAGSEFLLDRFGRTSRGSVFEIITWGHLWVDLYHWLMSPSWLVLARAPLLNLVLVLAVAGLVIVAISGRIADGIVTRPALALCVTSVFVVVVTVAQHVSGGGGRYSRYLLPALGVAAALIAVGLDRLVPRVLPAVTAILLGWWSLAHVPSGVDPASERRPRDRGGPMPELLQVLPASPWLRTAAGALIGVGCAGLLAALVGGMLGTASRGDHDAVGPAEAEVVGARRAALD
jgi:hypothetical protein